MTLKELATGKSAVIRTVGASGALRQHFLDMGMIPGAEVTVVKFAPMGDPMELQVHGYELTLRLAEAEQIEVEEISERTNSHFRGERLKPVDHPGLGEEGKYHSEEDANPLPDGTVLTYALVGNQNCGKTTLFNQLTGANQHVGNFPGVTVDRKDGTIKGYPNTNVTDLPGIYSMSPYSSEEIVSRNFVLDEHPKAIINIVDATNIERNLYLTMQLLEMDIPMVVALNMMDEVIGNHGSIDVNTMEALLGVPVIPISAAKNEGVDEVIRHALHVAKYQERPLRQDFCDKSDHDGAVHRCIHAVIHLIEDHAEEAKLPVRFAATKAIEGDPLILEQLKLDQNELDMLEHIVQQMETEREVDRSAAIADMRFDFIERLCEQTVVKPKESKERVRSEKIDEILTGKYTAIPCFIGIMVLVFYLTFNVIGAFLQGILEMGIDQLSRMAEAGLIALNVNDAIRSLVIDGIFTGVGSVLSFLPIIVTLFFFLSMMEDSGYIARVAFVMDKLLRKIGLSGRSIVPMLIGFGCTVPAVMATRTLTSERDRKMTILLTPFMSCSAKLPIYTLMISAFVQRQYRVFAMVGLYLIGIVCAVIYALILKVTKFKGEPVPFVMELPPYRVPTSRSVLRHMWERAAMYLRKMGGLILVASVCVWFLSYFPRHDDPVIQQEDSYIGRVGRFTEPLVEPLGLNWKASVALLTGAVAKEVTVSTLGVLYAGTDDDGDTAVLSQRLTEVNPQTGVSDFNKANALSFLVFVLLYFPCLASLVAIKQEAGGWKWAAFSFVYNTVVAWIIAFVVYHIAVLLI